MKLFVRRRGTNLSTIDDTKNWGQWMGLHNVYTPKGGGRKKKPCVILRDCGGTRLEHKSVEELVDEVTEVVESDQPFVKMRALGGELPVLGVLIFDSVKEMKELFWLD